MPVVAIPAKPLQRAKARLAPVLSAQERRALSLAMLADVCTTAAAVGSPVVIVASDDDVADVARACGAAVVADPTPDAGLNASLEAALPRSEEGLLILASDLPGCTPDDVRAMLGGPGVLCAPDAGGTGTNALWRMPADAIPPAFGSDSAAAHRRLAAERGVPFALIRRPGLAMDLDTPAHLKEAWDAPIGPNTRSALSDLGFPGRATEVS